MRVIVTVVSTAQTGSQWLAEPDAGSGVDPSGPFALAKLAALRDGGHGVRLLQDYDQLPTLLVEVADDEALARLAGSQFVRSAKLERRRTTN